VGSGQTKEVVMANRCASRRSESLETGCLIQCTPVPALSWQFRRHEPRSCRKASRPRLKSSLELTASAPRDSAFARTTGLRS
jgi:hypothetical protein